MKWVGLKESLGEMWMSNLCKIICSGIVLGWCSSSEGAASLEWNERSDSNEMKAEKLQADQVQPRGFATVTVYSNNCVLEI